MKGWIGDREVTVLRDTRSTGVMVKAELVDPSQFTGRNQKLMMINSCLEEFLVAWIEVDLLFFLEKCKLCVCQIRITMWSSETFQVCIRI